MTLQPLRTQLDSKAPTASNDCSVVTLENAILWASDGRVGPQPGLRSRFDPQGQPAWARDIREWAGVTANRGLLFRSETFKAYQSHELRKRFLDAGIKPPIVQYVEDIGWGALRDRLKAGYFVHLAVNYGVLRKGDAPVGSLTFSGGHSIGLYGLSMQDKQAHTNDADPLFDGRRAGIPKGWQYARLLDFQAAAGTWGKRPPGVGHATCILVRKG